MKLRRNKDENTVRITGGFLKGRKIRTPGGETHPMGERERIALFNMIADRVRGNYVADLFCGGGTLAIEAYSRGAIWVFGFDISERAIEVAEENFANLGILPPSGMIFTDIIRASRTATDRFGVVIADPPYDKYDERDIQSLTRLVLDGGTFVLSHPGEAPELKGLTLEKTRQYAGAHISVYRKNVE